MKWTSERDQGGSICRVKVEPWGRYVWGGTPCPLTSSLSLPSVPPTQVKYTKASWQGNPGNEHRAQEGRGMELRANRQMTGKGFRPASLPVKEPRNAEPTSSPAIPDSLHKERPNQHLTCYIGLNAWISKSHPLQGSSFY